MAGQEDEALLAEIAKLTGQIDQHRKQPHQQSDPYTSDSSYRASTRGRGSSSYRGAWSTSSRGRGGISSSAYPTASKHRSLVINHGNPSSGSTSAPSSSSPPKAADHASTLQRSTADSSPAPHQSQQSWVKTQSTHNMRLVNSSVFEKTEPARIAALQASQEAKAKARAEKAQARAQATAARAKQKPSSDVRRGDNMGEVIIDGVVFVFDETGTKLVKKPVQPVGEAAVLDVDNTQVDSSTSTSPSKAPLRTSVNGQAFVRTKGGNLISAELAEKRKAQKESQAKMKKMTQLGQQIGQNEKVRSANRKSQNKSLGHSAKSSGPKGLCSFFTKTGQCKRGLSCPYQHDSSKLAICPGALRPSGCNQPQGLCPLSHQLSPHRVPHCVHYLRSRTCRNGDNCLYAHPPVSIGISATSPVCMGFARVGWCPNGESCSSRHTFDCPDFLEKGTCERKGCKLQHVIRSNEQLQETSSVGTDNPKQESSSRSSLISAVGNQKKRKGDDEEEEAEEEEGVLSFAGNGRKKSKKAKGFTEQKDYIGFNEEDDEDEEDSSEEDDEDDGASVSSGSDSDGQDSSDTEDDSDSDDSSDSSDSESA
ncbi:unnamed protein product [Sympodiomycopsis kandeliae]